MDEKKLAAILAALIVIAIVGWLISFIRSPSPVIEETGNETKMKKVVNRLKPVMRVDPLKRCEVYKQHGCAHVDGPLCDVETCSMVVENENQKVIPIKVENG